MEWKIGSVTIPNQTVLGPMAGVTDLPFRLLCREQGAGLTVTEMISAKAITYGNRRTGELMRTRRPEETPLSLQLFGHEPEVIAEAAERIEGEAFDILDLNMGCPVPKIVNNHEGSYLMKDPDLIERIVTAAVQHSSRPVTVKLRAGFDCDHFNAPDCARAAEAGGASAVAIHARTRTQMYAGHADWTRIREVREAVKIPVVGNGDIRSGADAKRMLEETGCTAVMVARAAEGNPWIFRDINTYLDTGKETEPPSRKEIIQMILRHCALVREIIGEREGILEIRKHVAWYLAGFPGASKVRQKVNTVTSFEELESLLRKEFPYA
ncbi:MAG: tRNA dihydrouridine synthase DusB [Firmicutes bacterium]|nr:tRNA dihydrouridine synthase DusB [Bacillota bacterium]